MAEGKHSNMPALRSFDVRAWLDDDEGAGANPKYNVDLPEPTRGIMADRDIFLSCWLLNDQPKQFFDNRTQAPTDNEFQDGETGPANPENPHYSTPVNIPLRGGVIYAIRVLRIAAWDYYGADTETELAELIGFY